MIVEYIRYHIPAAQTEAFLDAYRRAQAPLDASPHCVAYELRRCHEAPEQFILRIEWDSLEGHLRGFRTGAQFAPFLQAVQPFVPLIEEMRHYEATTVVSHGR